MPVRLLIAAGFSLVSGLALASDCTRTSVGRTPIDDLGAGLYLGQYQGGLFPNGQNTPPPGHDTMGWSRGLAVEPLDTSGNPDASGKYVMVSIGMSNTTQEFCCHPTTFMGRAAADPDVNHSTLAIVNGAAGGQSAATWDSPTDANYNRVRNMVLAPQGLSEMQVQVAWVKLANPNPTVSLPNANADAFTQVTQIGNVVRALRTRYPNLKQVFLSSRIYAGYADTSTLNPEPYAYEGGFSVKWVIEAQISQMNGGGIDPRAGDLNPNTVGAWVSWGPYLWADGLTARSDGLTWACSDLQSDGIHPSPAGQGKVGLMLVDFFRDSSYTRAWFRGTRCAADYNLDGVVGVPDIFRFLQTWFQGRPEADLNDNGSIDVPDIFAFLSLWFAGCP